MGLLDTNYQDQRLTASQKKKIKPAIQGGGYNYLGEQEEVTVPRKWLSDPDHVVAELVYITPREKKVLIDLNMYGSLDGKPNNAPGGLPSLQGDMGSVGGGGNNDGGGGGGGRDYSSIPASKPKATVAPSKINTQSKPDARESYGAGGQYQQTTTPSTPSVSVGGGDKSTDRIVRIAQGTEPGYTPTSSQPFGLSPEQAYQEGKITADQYQQVQQAQDSLAVDNRSTLKKGFDSIIDFYKQGGLLGLGVRAIEPFTKGIQQKAMTWSLNQKINNVMGDLDLSNPNEMNNPKLLDLQRDLSGVQSGSFTQADYTSKYGSGDATNPLDASFNPDLLSGGQRQELTNLFTPEITYAISGTTPQQSMVNQYFANMGTMGQQPLSSNLQTSYNNAKTTINNLLGITPPSQQFGYSAQPYGLLSSTNVTSNPFNIDYLKRLGLI
jgi:hypothetical protein